jgi:hypothetical protein
VNVYLDASALVPLFTADIFTARTDEFLRTKLPVLIVISPPPNLPLQLRGVRALAI